MQKEDLYKLGERIGLNSDDIDNLLNYEIVNEEQVYLSCGPNYSPGFLYGTISTYDF
jgi:hypothetical protein